MNYHKEEYLILMFISRKCQSFAAFLLINNEIRLCDYKKHYNQFPN